MKKYISVDVGGTAIKYSLMDEEGKILERNEIPTPRDTLEHYLDTLTEIYRKYAKEAEAFVMAAPGRINAETGYFHTGGALSFVKNLDMKEVLKERIPLPFAAENDARAAALAEMWKGSMRGVNNGAVLTLGTGIGGAVIINGEIYRGSSFCAGELSNILIDWRDPLASGNSWHYLGGVGHLSDDYADALGKERSQMNGRIFFEAANNGDEKAMELLHRYCARMAGGIFSMQCMMDLEKYAFGGGISRQPLLMQVLQEELDKIFDAKSGKPVSEPEITVCEFSSDANMIGALYHYLTIKE